MRIAPILFASLILSGCAAPLASVDDPASLSRSAMAAAFTSDPAPEPTPLPPRDPPARLQREIEAMSADALARWILPGQASRIARVELVPPRWGVLNYAVLWQAPRPAGPPGICAAEGWGVSFRIENERALTDQQRLNPPLRPYQTVPERRYRAGGGDCAAPTPYWQWPTAPSAGAMHHAAALMAEAQARARSGGAPGYRLVCAQMRWDERTGATLNPACPEPRAFIGRLMPALMKRVRATDCQGEISRLSEGECVAIEYDDPDAPRTSSFYMVRIDGRGGLKSVEIVQGMMPPH